MNNIIPIKKNRKVIPRWRPFKRAIKTGELNFSENINVHPKPAETKEISEDLKHAMDEWNDNRSLSFAADFVSQDFIEDGRGLSKEAADYILSSKKNASIFIKELASIISNQGKVKITTDEQSPINQHCIKPIEADEFQKELKHLRARLQVHSRDAIGWADASFMYASLGLRKQALRAMETALSLFPENRYLLRSASRLFLHVEDSERAYSILAKSESVKRDPWLVSAVTAISDLLGKHDRFNKLAYRMLDNKNFSAQQISELACAKGTQEFSSGSIKKGKSLLKQSIVLPTENVVAQIVWMQLQKLINTTDSLSISSDFLKAISSDEAYTYSMTREKKWNEALGGSLGWLCDQPLSKTPAIIGSYIAMTYLDDYKRGESIARIGLTANPNDSTLWNNLAFSLLNQNDIDGAKKIIAMINVESLSESDRIALVATTGLMHYKEKNIDIGRAEYLEAIRLAEIGKNSRLKALAAINLAKAELASLSSEANKFCSMATQFVKEAEADDFEELLVKYGIVQ